MSTSNNTVEPGQRIGRAIALKPYDDGSYEWHKQRLRGIGGSDAATILGYEPYGEDRKKLWRRKTQREEGFMGNTATKYGSRMEPYLFDELLFRADADASMRPFQNARLIENQLKHPEHEWMRANTDGFIVPDGTPTGGIEIKTSKYTFDGVNKYHYPQMQHYMGVTGLQTWYYVYFQVPFDRQVALEFATRFLQEREVDEYWSWVIDQGSIYVKEVEADPGYIIDLMEVEEDFWGYVQRDEEPPKLRPDGEVEVDDATLASKFDRYAELKQKVNKSSNPFFSDEDLGDKEDDLDDLKEDIKARLDSIRASKGVKKVFVHGDYGEHKGTWCGSYFRLYEADAPIETDKPF